MSGMGHMHPDLMGAAGFQPAIHQGQYRRRTETFGDPRPCYRMAPSLEQHRLALAVVFVARQLGGDFQDIAWLETHAA